MPIRVGGDPESYMEAPELGVAGGGPSFIASLLDLVGLHRQVAKGPKAAKAEDAMSANPQPQAVVPQVLTDVSSALTPQETPILPTNENAPMSSWGQRWIESLKPLTSIDPNSAR